MILPATYATALALAIISMLCLGSWANALKLTRKWRFELFYFDFTFGVFLTALIAALTFGSMGDELSVHDNLLVTGKRQIAYAFAAGGVFNLANILLVAAISIAGMAVAFPVAIGLALVIGVLWTYVLRPAGNPMLLFGGAFLVAMAIVMDALAYRAHARTRSTRSRFSVKGLVLSLASGLLMGSFYRLVEMSMAGEFGLGPYTVAVVFAAGLLLTTFVFNLYFMNLPVQGEPLGVQAYFARKSISNHMLGLLGGIVWCAGAIMNFVAASAPPEARVGPASSYALNQAATMIAAVWGLVVWKEFAGATGRVKVLLAIMFVLFASGLTLVSVARLSGS